MDYLVLMTFFLDLLNHDGVKPGTVTPPICREREFTKLVLQAQNNLNKNAK